MGTTVSIDTDGEPLTCKVDIVLPVRAGQAAQITLTEQEPRAYSRLPAAIEAIATTLYYRYLSHLPPEQLRWFEHWHDPETGADSVYAIRLSWVPAGMFDPAGYRRPQWRAVPRLTPRPKQMGSVTSRKSGADVRHAL